MPPTPPDPAAPARLATLLLPYRTGGIGADENDFRFHDAPVEVVAAALAVVHADYLDLRAGSRPPARWVLDVCRRLDGRPGGTVSTWRRSVRLDALSVPVANGRALLAEVVRDRPDAASLALVGLWESWDARQALLEKAVRDVTDADLRRPDAAVLGLWWE